MLGQKLALYGHFFQEIISPKRSLAGRSCVGLLFCFTHSPVYLLNPGWTDADSVVHRSGDLPIIRLRSFVTCRGGFSFIGPNFHVTVFPQLFDHLDTPAGAFRIRPNRPIADDEVDRIGVELWKMTERNPAAFFDWVLKFAPTKRGQLKILD